MRPRNYDPVKTHLELEYHATFKGCLFGHWSIGEVHGWLGVIVLANIFMSDFEEKWVMNNGARPTIWFRYVDDTFTLFNNKDTAVQFLSYLNSRHKDIQFTIVLSITSLNGAGSLSVKFS